ncbi:hypothetical protein [Corynebacterium striatum]|nr:conserved hypothetical protein [Corynebacterium striatum]
MNAYTCYQGQLAEARMAPYDEYNYLVEVVLWCEDGTDITHQLVVSAASSDFCDLLEGLETEAYETDIPNFAELLKTHELGELHMIDGPL